MYAEAEGIPHDYAQAMIWLRKAADQGDAEAQQGVGTLYRDGLGVPHDYMQAMGWFRKAADQNYALAQAKIGGMYLEGLGVAEDHKQDLTWYRKAARQGVPQSNSEAAAWYRKAADKGFKSAQEKLADLQANKGQRAPDPRGPVGLELTCFRLGHPYNGEADSSQRHVACLKALIGSK
jgi:uncharacterized protein